MKACLGASALSVLMDFVARCYPTTKQTRLRPRQGVLTTRLRMNRSWTVYWQNLRDGECHLEKREAKNQETGSVDNRKNLPDSE